MIGDIMENLYDVGKIVNTHGVKGEVRVIRITDFEERFTPGNTLYIVHKKDDPIPVTVKSHRTHKQFDLIAFEEFPLIDHVEKYKNSLLKVAASDLTSLGEGEFYYHEIIGCTVESDEDEKIGKVTAILSPGANDVWVVETVEGKEVLIPYIKDVVKEVNIDEKHIRIHLLEGLMD